MNNTASNLEDMPEQNGAAEESAAPTGRLVPNVPLESIKVTEEIVSVHEELIFSRRSESISNDESRAEDRPDLKAESRTASEIKNQNNQDQKLEGQAKGLQDSESQIASTNENLEPDESRPKTTLSLTAASINLVKALGLATISSIRGSVRYSIHHPIHILFDLALLTLLALVVYTGIEINDQLILDRISDKTVNEVISASRFGHTFDAEEVERSGARTLLGVGAPEWLQRESVRAILYHARKAGMSVEDQAVLLAIADIESGFNPLARAPTSTACGLFQFIKRTGENFRLTTEQCMDPWENARAGVEHYVYNYEKRVIPLIAELEGAERVFRAFELSYYFHHDGIASNNPSNDLKAIILSGTQFLFRIYHVLREEAQVPDHAPGFAEKFTSNFSKMVDSVMEHWRRSGLYSYFFSSDSALSQ